MQYDPLPGSAHRRHRRPAAPRSSPTASTGSWPSPTRCSACSAGPTRRSASVCFRIYNEHIAEMQERSGGRIYGVGLINWWDGDGARRTLAELKELGLKTFLHAAQAGQGRRQGPIDYASPRCTRVWEAIEESGLPVSHHIGETPPASPSAYNTVDDRHAPVRGAVPRDVRHATCSAGSSTATPACRSAGSRAASTGCRRRCRTPSTSTPRSSTWPTTSSEHDPQHYWDAPHDARRSWSTRSGSS